MVDILQQWWSPQLRRFILDEELQYFTDNPSYVAIPVLITSGYYEQAGNAEGTSINALISLSGASTSLSGFATIDAAIMAVSGYFFNEVLDINNDISFLTSGVAADIVNIENYLTTVSADLSQIHYDINTVSGLTASNTSLINTTSGNLQLDINNRVLRSGDLMTGFLTLFSDPVTSGHAATKQYVDSKVSIPITGKNQNTLVLSTVQSIDLGFGLLASSGTGNELEVSVTGMATFANLTAYSGFAEGKFIDISEVAVISGNAVTTASIFTTNSVTTYSGFAEGRFVNTSGDSMTGFLTLNADPTLSGHSSNKFYVDQRDSSISGYFQNQVNILNSGVLDVSNSGSLNHNNVGNINLGFGLQSSSGVGNNVNITTTGLVSDTTFATYTGNLPSQVLSLTATGGYRVLSYSYADNGNVGIQINSTSYQTVSYISFPGTLRMGPVNFFEGVFSVASAGSVGQARVYNLSNNTTVASGTFSGTSPGLFSLSTSGGSALPSGSAVFRVELRRNSGNGNMIIHGLSILGSNF
jgi:hypothetical protein